MNDDWIFCDQVIESNVIVHDNISQDASKELGKMEIDIEIIIIEKYFSNNTLSRIYLFQRYEPTQTQLIINTSP